MTIDPAINEIVQDLAGHFSKFSPVEAVVLAGSQTSSTADALSDVDLYVYAREGAVPLQARKAIVQERAEIFEVNNRFWEHGDEWIETDSGIHVDVIYRGVSWVINEVQQVMTHHAAKIGYSTSIAYNVAHSVIYYDQGNWFSELQKTTHQPYPDALRAAIIHKNHPILRTSLPSYKKQVSRALQREDYVSVHHRLTALIASYFDVLFALNQQLHPGEKRMLEHAEAVCEKRPNNLREAVMNTLYGDDPIKHIDDLCDELDELLIAEGFIS